MFGWLSKLLTCASTTLRATGQRPPRLRLVRARYDAASLADDNRRHWAQADSLSANAANSPEARRLLRNRARYEVANNSYARGIVLTLAGHSIDGIVFDDAGNPQTYHVLRAHPGESRGPLVPGYDEFPADAMLHWFRPDRPGQARGVPDIMPALPLAQGRARDRSERSRLRLASIQRGVGRPSRVRRRRKIVRRERARSRGDGEHRRSTLGENQNLEFAQWVDAQRVTIDVLSKHPVTAFRAMHAAQSPQPKEGEPPAAESYRTENHTHSE